jgi:hypothetical protein
MIKMVLFSRATMIINMLPRPIIDTLMRFEQMHYIDSLENYVN